MRFTSEPSYLNHPSAYYRLLALGPDITGALAGYRLLNTFMIAGALLLLFATVFAALEEDQLRIAGTVLVGTVPVMAQLGGSVNNDNLAILGGALAIYGAARYLPHRSLASLGLICAGLLLAALAKLTGLMLCGAFVALLFAQVRPSAKHLLILAAALSLAVLPYISLWVSYGSPAPETPGQLQMLAEGAREAGWDRQLRLTPWAYLVDFSRQMLSGWMPHLGGRTTLQSAALALPLSLFAIAAIGCWHDPITRAGAGAVAMTSVVHLVFSYERHLETGWLLDAYPRYYLPLLGIWPLAMANTLRKAPAWLTWFVIAAPFGFALLA
jgi:hypothetical protein